MVSKVAIILVEINSRLSGLSCGEYQLHVKSVRKKVQLRRLEMDQNFETPKVTLHKTFNNYKELYAYLVPFRDALDFVGL